MSTTLNRSGQDYAVLAEIADVLKRHGYTQRFGVCLLHRHFDVANDEVAMEITDVEARTSIVRVEKRPVADEGSQLETMWRFRESGDTQLATVCVKQCSYSSGHKQVHVKQGRQAS